MRLRTHLYACGLFAVASLLAACGGSNSPSVGPIPGGGSGVTPSPVNTSDRPAAAGDTFAYAGTITQEFVNAPVPSVFTTPDPNPTVSATITTAVTQTVSVATPASFNGVSNPYDFHTVETDVANGGLRTTTVTSDDYYNYVTGGTTTPIYFLGSTSSNSDDVSFSTTIGTGNGLVDIIPESAGTLSPANNAAQTTTETDPDGLVISTGGPSDQRVTNADGSYTEEYANAASVTSSNLSTAMDAADGSGSYAYQILIPELSTVTYSAPAATSPYDVTVSLTVPGQLAPTPGSTPYTEPPVTVPAFYPVPVVLASQSIVDSATTSLPTTCAVPAKLLSSGIGHTIVSTTSSVDTVFGELDTTTQTTYTEQGTGVVCETLNDVVTLYYDYSGQTQAGAGIYNSPTPIETVTTNETLALTSATVLGTSVRTRALAGHDAALALRPGVARFHQLLARQRYLRHTAFARALAKRLNGVHR